MCVCVCVCVRSKVDKQLHLTTRKEKSDYTGHSVVSSGTDSLTDTGISTLHVSRAQCSLQCAV